ncbi:hypothetical protein DFQ28_011513 [Apophysomyces sp. BC1034]|nr:hypothetical protein DFQ30_010930 [Apophysomyces sp. BC1015]KAG0168958.1 hypothetical protein DFQ29_009962 [Apophysomyces sp. BC1021]KAG0184255.1 hypothetical protein DFQ28_011513 [Apophysomyces sp. BC1034]
MESPHDMVANLTQPHSIQSVYNPVDISSIVHSPTMTVPELPATLPPLNPTILNTPSSININLQSPQPLEELPNKRHKSAPKSRERAPWTPEEDNLLRLAVQLYGDKTEKWAKIAACVPGRTNKNCRKRWFHSLDPSLRKGAWTDEEDQLLREGVMKYPNQWSKIADMLEGRTDDQCAKRWRESLDPNIDRSDWTMDEDRRLMDRYEEYGSQWQKIAQFFDGRPGLHCRNRWRKLQRILQMKKDKEGAAAAAAAATATATTSFVNGLADDQLNRFTNHQAHRASDSSPLTSSSTSTTSSPANSNRHLTAILTQPDPSVLAQFEGSSGTTAVAVAAVATAGTVTMNESSHELEQDFSEPHSDLNPYGCDVAGCYASFSASTGLFYHMKNVHPNLDCVDKPYRCAMPNCTKRYKNINGLQYHLREAKGSSGHAATSGADDTSGDRPYKCQIASCKKAYRTTNGLRYHQTHGHNFPSLPVNDAHADLHGREKWLLEQM